jgi:glycosyltransferase involved in cell wall biosynthesis
VRDSGALPRIAVFTKQLDSWTSGSGHHLNEIMTAALDLNNGRFEFTFVHYRPGDNRIYTRVRELVVPRNPLGAAAVLRRERFDVVHYTPLTIYAPIWGVPGRKVATIHGAEQLIVPQYYGQIELAHERLVVPLYARRMDRIVTVSETSARFFTERFGVEPARIAICTNGLAPVYRVMAADEISAPRRFGVGLPYVFHVSRLSERKNPWTLLDAFARLVRDYHVPHTLVCAGGGWNSERVRERVRSLGIAGRFVAPGFLPERDVAELMNAASAFIFPSLAEGFGMPNVEAMACGCPVITTPGFAIREVVGDAAVIVENPDDAAALARAVHGVLSNAELRAGLVKRGLARITRFSWKTSAERLLSVYAELAAL